MYLDEAVVTKPVEVKNNPFSDGRHKEANMTTESQQLGLPKSERIQKRTIEEGQEHCHDGAPGQDHRITAGAATDSLASVAVVTHHHPQQSILSRVGRFALHYLEMCLAMCVGGITLNVLFFLGAEQLGYTNLPERYPEFSILVIGILLAIPMAIWMRFRGHDWRSNLEMSGTSVILAILLIGAFWLGAISRSAMLEWIKALACPAMLIPMLFRLDLYTESHASHARHALPKAS
jgi:hypothetical protein